MATHYLKLDKNFPKKLITGIARPINNMKPYFKIMETYLIQQTNLAFKLSGKRGGHAKWRALAKRTVKSTSGSWNIRYGTDGTPKPIYKKGDGKWRKYRKGVRRYNSRTEGLLQASGMFMKSFKTFGVDKRSLRFGTNYKMAQEIMSNPTRNVLFLTKIDRQVFLNDLVSFYSKGLKF